MYLYVVVATFLLNPRYIIDVKLRSTALTTKEMSSLLRFTTIEPLNYNIAERLSQPYETSKFLQLYHVAEYSYCTQVWYTITFPINGYIIYA